MGYGPTSGAKQPVTQERGASEQSPAQRTTRRAKKNARRRTDLPAVVEDLDIFKDLSAVGRSRAANERNDDAVHLYIYTY